VKKRTWGEVERFCRSDGWRESRRSGHVFFEKVLADGTVLQTRSLGLTAVPVGASRPARLRLRSPAPRQSSRSCAACTAWS
jgi:hypothetical protein